MTKLLTSGCESISVVLLYTYQHVLQIIDKQIMACIKIIGRRGKIVVFYFIFLLGRIL